MALIQEELEVSRPLDEVFAFVGDFANTKRWDPGVAQAEKATDGPIGVGTLYRLKVLFNGRELPMTYEVTAWDPPERVVLRGRAPRSVPRMRSGSKRPRPAPASPTAPTSV